MAWKGKTIKEIATELEKRDKAYRKKHNIKNDTEMYLHLKKIGA